MAKQSSSGRRAGPRPSKAGRKSVTIDLDAEEVGKADLKGKSEAGAAGKPVQPAPSGPVSAKAEPSKAASEPAKTGPLKADATAGEAQPGGGKAEAGTAKAAEAPTKSGAAGVGRQAAGSRPQQPSGAAKPAALPTVPSAASRFVAGLAGGIIALGGAVALDRLQILPIFGADPGLPRLQTEIADVRQEAGDRIADLQAQIAALPSASGADGLAGLGDKITQIETSLSEQGARIAKAEQPGALAELGARLTALETAVQTGAAGPDAGLAAIEQKLAGVEKTIAGNRRLVGEAADNAIAAIKPEIEQLGAIAEDLARRVTTLEGSLSELVDPQIVAALGARIEQLADVIEKNAAPQTVAALKSALAAQSLAAAMSAGRPFAAELDILRSDADGGPDLTAIAAYAADGLPDAAALAAEFEALVPSLMPPEPQPPAMPESAGLIDRLLASARNVVEVRPAGPPAGGQLMRQADAILQALNGNNLKGAQSAWQGLPVEARQASAGWAAKLQARLAADALAGSLRTEALSRLAEAGAGEGQ